MKDKSAKIFRSFTFYLIAAFIFMILVISMVISSIGYYRFSKTITDEYYAAAYRTANTAMALINPKDIDRYIEENEPAVHDDLDRASDEEKAAYTEEYKTILKNLDYLCKKQYVSIVYVIKLKNDGSGYYSVINIPNSETTKYTPWRVNLEKNAEDQEYKDIYKKFLNKEIKEASVVRTNNKNKSIPDHITSLVAIEGTEEGVTALMCIQKPMETLRETRNKYMATVGIFTFLLIVLVAVTWYFYLRYQVVNPLQRVVTEAERFAKQASAPEKPLGRKLSRIYEIASLAKSIDNMEKETLEYIENLKNVTSERERISAELNLASQIQENSIPRNFPAFPDRKEFDLYANMTPAKEVGGDFYAFFLIDDDHLAIAVADVSGKGVPAALFMMVTMILINEHAMLGGTPDEILEFVNKRICSHNEAEMFVTVWLGILEISTGKITAANAGHDDPVIYRKGKKFEVQKDKHGIVIGAMDDAKYKPFEIQLEKGDKIFLYTDGIPEATRSDNKMFGVEGMLASLNKHKDLEPQKIIEGMKQDVEAFIGDAPQFDDMTMLCVEYKGADNQKTLTIEAVDENLDKVNEFLASTLKGGELSKKALTQLQVAVEEIFINIAHYAYKPEDGNVVVNITNEKDAVFVSFEDEGKPYNPLEREDPDISLSADEREVGGLGIYLTKKLVDKVQYERKGNKNILILEKKF